MAAKRRLQFSLRTFVLLMLFVGSLATVWWRWEPWALVASIPLNDDKEVHWKILAGNQLVYSNGWGLTFCDLKTGKSEKLSYYAWTCGGAVPYSPDGKWILTDYANDSMQLLNRAKGTKTPVPFPDECTTMSYSTDGRWLAIAFADGAVHLWNLETLRCEHTLHDDSARIDDIQFTADGAYFCAHSLGGRITIWNSADGTKTGGIEHPETAIIAQVLAPQHKTVIALCADRVVRVYSVPAAKLLLELRGHDDLPYFAAFSSRHDRIVTTGWDCYVCVWDAANGALITKLPRQAARVNAAGFSPNSAKLITAGSDGRVCLWDIATRQPLLLPDGVDRLTKFVPESPLSVKAPAPKAESQTDETSPEQAVTTVPAFYDQIWSAGFSNDGRYIFVDSDRDSVWFAASGQIVQPTPEGDALGVLPDGPVLTQGGNKLNLWVQRRDDVNGARIWMPEIWLAGLIALILLWSISHERKA